ncbi:MAG: adenylate/guanylate cyclase domain-containing protein [Treponema sp.]|nr:adenylate/guanylate cyclase domain-containing protein [Treponema sp.]
MAICTLIFFLTLITGNLSKERRFAILLLEFSAFFWLFGSFAYNNYKDNLDTFSFYFVRIGKFCDYFFSNFIVFSFGLYLKDLFSHEGALVKKSKRLLIADIIVFLGMALVVANLFLGFYYYFDENNNYCRGPGRNFFYLSSLFPLLLQLSCIIHYYRRFSRRIRIPMLLFATLPLLATLLQFFYKGIYVASMSAVGMAIVIYIFTIQEMNKTIEKAHRLEVEMLERYKKELEETVKIRTKELRIANEKANNLLLNILPKDIARELTEKPGKTISKKYPNATVLFTDIVGFTKMSSSMTAEATVTMLNRMVSLFDERCEKEGIEKIKTIGDAYMAVTGLSDKVDNKGSLKMLNFAQGLLNDVRYFNDTYKTNIQIRIGINSGDIVAGVIGKKKFIYDVWGDTVNVASRMESSGSPMQIHVSESCYQQTKDKISYKEPVQIEIKGKGLMKTYFVSD